MNPVLVEEVSTDDGEESNKNDEADREQTFHSGDFWQCRKSSRLISQAFPGITQATAPDPVS